MANQSNQYTNMSAMQRLLSQARALLSSPAAPEPQSRIIARLDGRIGEMRRLSEDFFDNTITAVRAITEINGIRLAMESDLLSLTDEDHRRAYESTIFEIFREIQPTDEAEEPAAPAASVEPEELAAAEPVAPPAPMCAGYCGEELDFVAGVLRCPEGHTAHHAAVPGHDTVGIFWHRDCIAGDVCTLCERKLDGYMDEHGIAINPCLVHDLTTLPNLPEDVFTERAAARWSDEFLVHQVGMLCYATAASAISRAFGVDKDPLECAHDWALIMAASYPNYLAAFDLTPTDLSVHARQKLVGDGDLMELTGQYGEMVVADSIAREEHETVEFDVIRQAIDADSLIAVGNEIHFVVVFGYSLSTQGRQRVTYYDPGHGGRHDDSWRSFRAGRNTFRIYG